MNQISTFANALQGAAPDVIGMLNAPRSASEVADLVGLKGFAAPDEVSRWFGWHDGIDLERGVPLFLGWRSIPLAEGLRRSESGGIVPDFLAKRLGIDTTGWLLLLEQSGYAQLYIDLSESRQGRVPVMKIRADDGEVSRVALSIGELCTAWLGVLESGVVWNRSRWVAPGGLEPTAYRATGYL